MGLSRQEVNLRRLLAKCELMVKNKQKEDDRFPKYVESLKNMLLEVQHSTDTEHAMEYSRRIKILINLITPDVSVTSKGTSCYGDNENILLDKNLTEREELLGQERNVRLRNPGRTDDLDELLEYNKTMQEKIADDMLTLTRNLKEQSELANKIIKKDTEMAGKSATLTEKNLSKLKSESEKLSEHSKRAWKCWMWIMLLIVMAVFINMVLFMKIMKKKI